MEVTDELLEYHASHKRELMTRIKSGRVISAANYVMKNQGYYGVDDRLQANRYVDDILKEYLNREKTLVSAIEYLWKIIDDIDTYGDMSKSDDSLFRHMVETRQKDRWKIGVESDGYKLDFSKIRIPDGV